MKITITIIICLLLALCTFGQNNTSPPSQIDRLSFKIGKWKWETKGLTTPGDPKYYKGVGYSHVYPINGSNSLIDDHKIEWENGISYQAITYRTFDAKSKKYMVVWAQANSSNTSKIEGHWEGDKFVEIETGTDGFGSWTNRLEIYDILPDSHKARLVRTYKTGFKLTILEYSAVKISAKQTLNK